MIVQHVGGYPAMWITDSLGACPSGVMLTGSRPELLRGRRYGLAAGSALAPHPSFGCDIFSLVTGTRPTDGISMMDMADTKPLVQSCGAWRTKALERHVALRLNYGRMLAWYDTVMETVGPAWFEGQSVLTSSKARTLADAHPLYRFLSEGTDTALIYICELGKYIESFKSDPATPRIAQDLISPKFPSTLFELAMAYRWRIAGGQITLQPPAAEGRIGDFSAVLNEVPFIVEASNISAETFEKLSFRAPLLIRKTVPLALLSGSVLLVKAIFRTIPTGAWEDNLRRSVKECCYDLGAASNSAKPLQASREGEGYRIDIERMTEPEPFEDETTKSECWDVRFDQITETAPHELKLRILIRFPPDEASALRILKKLDKEARQLHGVRGARIVLLDISGIEPNALELDTEALRQGLRAELIQTPELACVWMVSRVWTTEMRYQYRVVFIPNPESPFQLPHSFVERFASKERSWDFLGETQIEHTTEEEARRRFLGRQPTFEGYLESWD